MKGAAAVGLYFLLCGVGEGITEQAGLGKGEHQ